MKAPLPHFSRSQFGTSSHGELVLDGSGIVLVSPLWPSLKQSAPEPRRVKGPGAVVHGRVYIREEVPDVANNHTHNLILGHRSVHDETEPHKHPRQVRRRENEKAEEAEPGLGVASGPDVYQGRRQGVA